MITLDPPRGISSATDPWQVLGVSRAGLTRFVQAAQKKVRLRGEVSVLLADDRMLRRLNREFRHKDKATDVLSFPAPEELRRKVAGDLAISVETAQRQADEHGHTLREELRILLLHGLLHLNGMDHETDDGEMAAKEAELRRELRLRPTLIVRAGQAAKAPQRAKAARRKVAR